MPLDPHPSTSGLDPIDLAFAEAARLRPPSARNPGNWFPNGPDRRAAERRLVRWPPERPAGVAELVNAIGDLADAAAMARKAEEARAEGVRRKLGLVRPRLRAPEEVHRAYEVKAAMLGLESILAGSSPLDPQDAEALADLVFLRGQLARAEARVERAREAVAERHGEAMLERVEREAPTGWERKRAFHHGDLREAAIRVAVERLARGGPPLVTMRGVARELGVSGAALAFHFRNVEGFKSAVAAALLEQLAVYTGTATAPRRAVPRMEEVPVEAQLAPRRAEGPTWTHDLAEFWIDYAAENPGAYKHLSGEGWHRPGLAEGVHPGGVWSPRTHLQRRTEARLRGAGAAGGAVEPLMRAATTFLAHDVAMSVHGLALARIDGAPDSAIRAGIARLAAAAPLRGGVAA